MGGNRYVTKRKQSAYRRLGVPVENRAKDRFDARSHFAAALRAAGLELGGRGADFSRDGNEGCAGERRDSVRADQGGEAESAEPYPYVKKYLGVVPKGELLRQFCLWAEGRLVMFDFVVKGTVVGFNTSTDGTKNYVKILPSGSVSGLNRDERPGILDVHVSPGDVGNLAMNAKVVARGKGIVYLRDWRDPREGTTKVFTNYRFEADVIEPAKE